LALNPVPGLWAFCFREGEMRENAVMLRLNIHERATVEAAAQAVGDPVSTWARDVVLRESRRVLRRARIDAVTMPRHAAETALALAVERGAA
jgi:uncharacterized protein (DUF1778 family)